MFKRYALRHASNNDAMVGTIIIPPRLLEWTNDINDAHIFESEIEAQDCADYIKKVAWNVEVFELDVGERDHRIVAEEQRWQKAADSTCDNWGVERITVKITK